MESNEGLILFKKWILGCLSFAGLEDPLRVDVEVNIPIISVQFLSNVILESAIFFLYFLVAMKNGLVFPVFEIDKTGFELLFSPEFAFD